METKRDFIWKMGGQQGQGVESCGEILGRVLAQEGYSLFSQRLFASRIKGGHTTIALRIATKEVATIGEHVDCLVALDQETIDLHGREVPEGGVIIADDAFHPKFEAHSGRIMLALPITELAKKYGSLQMKNIAALGMSAGVLGFPENPFYGFIADRFAKKGEEIITKNKEIFKEGYDTAIAAMHGVELGKLATPPKKDQLYLLGNEAAAVRKSGGWPGICVSPQQHQCCNSHDDTDQTARPPHRRRAARTSRFGIRHPRNARIPARRRRARPCGGSLFPLCSRYGESRTGAAHTRQSRRIRRARAKPDHPHLGRKALTRTAGTAAGPRQPQQHPNPIETT